jgi:nucleoside-diphosphate-sugar epimerase
MEGVDAVFHVAGWYSIGVRDPGTAYRVNVDGTRNVLELMQELGVPRGVYTSTLTINSDTNGELVDESYRFEGEHLSLYDRTKWIAHHKIAEPMMKAGLPLTIVMPGAIYGPGDTSATGDAIRDYMAAKLPMLPRESKICWGHVDDIAEGHLLALERGKPGESYIIAGPCHTFIEAFEIAERITGIPAPNLHLPPWLLQALSAPMGLIDRILPLPPEYSSEALRVLAGVTYLGSNSKARRELGYEPRSLEQGFRSTLQTYAQ